MEDGKPFVFECLPSGFFQISDCRVICSRLALFRRARLTEAKGSYRSESDTTENELFSHSLSLFDY
jgi:hypothetical protein